MSKPTWPRTWLLTLLLSAATATWAAAPGALVQVAESRSVADYDAGYRDGYNNLPNRYQERKRPDYAEGYRVGQARRERHAHRRGRLAGRGRVDHLVAGSGRRRHAEAERRDDECDRRSSDGFAERTDAVRVVARRAVLGVVYR